ncbi:MAG: hypothetical protein M1830_005834, partial [Pleopsidium flavum]
MVHLSHKEHHEPSTITEKGSSGTRIQKESTPTTTTKSVHPTKSVNATKETPATSHNQTGLEAETGKEVVLGVVKGVNLIVDGLMTKSLKNDGAPKDAAPKAKAVKPDPPKTAAQEPAQKAA